MRTPAQGDVDGLGDANAAASTSQASSVTISSQDATETVSLPDGCTGDDDLIAGFTEHPLEFGITDEGTVNRPHGEDATELDAGEAIDETPNGR